METRSVSIAFQRVQHLTRAERRRVKTIYRATFAPAYRHSFRRIMRNVEAGSRLLYVGRQNDQIVCMSILAHMPDTNAVYGEYIATNPALQNQGIGRQLFGFLTTDLGERVEVDALVIDAEMPETDDPNDIDRRRLNYHQRLGLRPIAEMAHYRVPFNKTGVPMCLMWMPLGERATPPDREEIAAWVKGIFTINGYSQAFADKLIAEMAATPTH